MNREYRMVKEFQAAIGPTPEKPVVLSNDTECMHHFGPYLEKEVARMKRYIQHEGGSPVLFRSTLMLEELVEFMTSVTMDNQADALGDIMYLVLGTFVDMGLEPEQIFNCIHAANMRKKFDDDKFHYNEFGKIVKPLGWEGPEEEIKEEIQRQINKDECDRIGGCLLKLGSTNCLCLMKKN